MKNVPDEYVRAVLGRVGEAPLPGDTRNRWGQARRFTSHKQETLVATPTFEIPIPLAVSLSFSADGLAYSPVLPVVGNDSVVVQLIRGIDQQSMPVTDEFEVIAGESQPLCAVIAQSLQVVVRVDGEPVTPIYVAVVVTPVTSLDCEQIVQAPVAGPVGWTNALRFQFDADGVLRTLSANNMRRVFVVQNRATTGLEISFSGGSAPGIFLPGGIDAIYTHSSPNPYYGELSFQHVAVDPTGFFTMVQSLAPFVAGFPDS